MSDGSLKVKVSLGYSFSLLFFFFPPISSLCPLGLRLDGFRFCFVLFFNIEIESVSSGSIDCSLLNVCLNKG